MSKSFQKPKGSILIWTVLLGIALTTIFFFFSQRLNLNTALQRKTMEAQNAELYLDSYANYLASLTFEELKQVAGQIEDGNGLTGTLSNSSKQIKGVVDVGETVTYQVSNGKAKVEWGLCSKNEAGRPFLVEPIETVTPTNCQTAYDQSAETPPSTSFTLKSEVAPVSYKITPMGDAIVYDKTWKMELELIVNPKKTLNLVRSFTPSE